MDASEDEVREWIEVALNCMASVADTQLHEESAQALYTIADAIADHFDIETTVITEENTVERKPPQFRIIDGSKPEQDD